MPSIIIHSDGADNPKPVDFVRNRPVFSPPRLKTSKIFPERLELAEVRPPRWNAAALPVGSPLSGKEEEKPLVRMEPEVFSAGGQDSSWRSCISMGTVSVSNIRAMFQPGSSPRANISRWTTSARTDSSDLARASS